MDRKLSVVLLVIMIGFPVYLRAQSASGIIAPNRMVDWSNAGVQGGIQNRTTVCATLSPGASASEINSAIASCPSGQVVYLNAGTYNLSSGITFGKTDNVTLRGAGANQTFLVFSAGSSCNGPVSDVCFAGSSNWSGGPNNTASWTGGYSTGTTTITLSSTSNLAVGNLLILDQMDDASDNGQVFVCGTQGVCSLEGPAGSTRSGRSQTQIVQVLAISGNNVTISPGLYMPNWSSSKSPGAWWATSNRKSDSIEDLSLDHSISNQQTGIMVSNAENCWVKGIRSLYSNRNHVWLQMSAHISVVDSYFYGTKNAVSQSYGIESYNGSDNLVQNNIFQHIVAALIANGPASGTVWAYNYVTDDFYATTGWMMASAWQHGAGADNELYEGNIGEGFTSDVIHGTHNFITSFRNYWAGWYLGMFSQTVAANIYSYGRYYNFVGNVLGQAGYHNNYEDVAPSGTSPQTSIYLLGWSGNGGTTSGSVPDDPQAASTLFRWGNYDVVSGKVKWDASEVPSSISPYSNPVPSSQSLPASFFLSAQPGWWTTPWGSPPWPAIGPDVSGGPGPGGHAYAIPAQLCYDNSSKNTTGVLNFSAKSCYSGSAAPSAPVDLGAVAH